MIGASLAGILASSFRQPWALTVQTTDVNQTWTVDINAGTSPAITIDWGDGSLNEYTTTGLKTHTYAAAGTYVARLRGRFASGGNIRFGSDEGNRQRLKSTSAVPYIPGLLSFSSTFRDCAGLTGAIPADLFRYNTLVSTSGFAYTFCDCSNLTSAPDLLFAYCPSCSSFSSALQNCNKLQLTANLFSSAGDRGTRFLNKSVNFTNAMRIGTFTGTQGTAPDLWNYDFGTGTPTKTTCFTGHTSSSVSNDADIPAEWK
jgi:hypothetical protein